MACGNNDVSRGQLTSQPILRPPITLRARLPHSSGERLKADVWMSRDVEFVDSLGTTRAIPAVDSPGEARWEPVPRPGAPKKAYTHMTGRVGWLGPAALLNRLPPEVAHELQTRRVIVLGTDPDQTWMNERGTRSNRYGIQKTVVRRAK